MSLPGLDLAQTAAETEYTPAPPTQINLAGGSEWRFEVSFGTTIRVKLLTGTAELFGTELAPSQTYTFSGTKAAIYTWHGCVLEISAGAVISPLDAGLGTAAGNGTAATTTNRGYGAGGCQSEYVAEETPMVEYANVHFALETLRQESKATGKDGPRTLILGPEGSGKTSLAKILTAYATKMDRQPIVVNLNPAEGMLSVPGTLTATTFRTMLDVEEGWGNSPMSGPSAVPVKLPLCYFYPMRDALEGGGGYYRGVVSRLALSVTGRMAEDEDTRETGVIVDTPGVLGSGKPGSLEMIDHIVTEFSITTILILGSERLYSTMAKTYDNKPTSSASAPATDERVTVLKLSKSGGCVDRDHSFMNAVRESQIRSYFFGNPSPSTAFTALPAGSVSGAGGSSSVALSPHAQVLDFGGLAVWYLAGGGGGGGATATEGNGDGGDDDDDYDPARLDSFLPGGTSSADTQPQDERTTTTSSSPTLQKLPLPPTKTLSNTLLAITHASAHASPPEVRDASIMGFLYVADVDGEKGKVRVLAPMGGRVPPRAVVWGGEWPGEVVGLVG